MATTEPGISPPATSGEVGRHLRTVRKAKGLSRAEVARSAGLTRRELAAYERGRTPVPDSDLWCLAGSCGVDVSDLLPSRDKLNVGSDLGSLTVGDSVRRLRAGAGSDGLLREYLAMIYELRNLPPGTRPPMREEDLAALADALGGTPEAIESRLGELIGASRDEAARLRVMILPPRALSAAPTMSFPPMGEFGDLNQYGSAPVLPPASITGSNAAPPVPATADAPAPSPFPPAYDFAMTANTTVGDPEATARFFDAPRANDDPFSSHPPMEALAPLDMSAAAVGTEPNAAPMAETAFAPSTDPSTDPTTEAMTAPTIGSMPEPFLAPPPAPMAAPSPEPFPAPMVEPPADVVASAPPGTFDPFAPPSVAPIDPFASPPSGPPLGAVVPGGVPVDPFNPPAAIDPSNPFDPGAFDPASFDPAAFAADPFNPPPVYDTAPQWEPSAFASEPALDPFGVDTSAGDPFGVEVVALAPESATHLAHPADNGAVPSGEDWMATWESLGQDTLADEALSDAISGPIVSPIVSPFVDEDDDPWAVLRIPVEGMVVDDGSDALALIESVEPVETVEQVEPLESVAAAEAVEASEPTDPFANAFEPVADDSTAFESAVFESAAFEPAAIEVPAAGHPFADLGELEATGFDTDEPADDWFDRAAAATAALVADHRASALDEPSALHETSTIDETSALDEGVAADLEADSLVTELVSDEPTDDTEDGDDRVIAAAVAGLAPIAWSLYSPTPEPAPEAALEGSTEADDDAGATTVAEAFAATSDAEFVTAGADWEVGGIFPATAMADDGTLALRRADVRWALADLVANDDFTVRATVDFTSGAGFGILFRVSTDDSERITGYSFDVDPIYSGGGFLLRQWHDSRQHWKPLAHAPVADTSRLYGQHTIEVTLRGDQLTATVDGETMLTVLQLSRCSIESGREPCRGGRLGVQAWSTTEVTVDRLMLANF